MPNLNQSGIVDLSALAPKPATPGAPGGASYVVEVTDPEFDAVVQKSVQHPVILEFYSPRANAQALSDMLVKLVNSYGGKLLLARVNVDTEQQLAADLKVTAVPLVAGVLAGQLVPLFQGTTDEEQAKAVIEQLLQLAAQNGIMGKAEPQAAAPGEEPAEAPVNPRFAAADAALEQGNYAAAVAEFEKLLRETPTDSEVQAGHAQAALLHRTQTIDARATLAAADAAPDDLQAQLPAADVDVLMGQFESGFDRLLRIVRSTTGDDRDTARKRLLELFLTVGAADPAVLKARRELTSALF